MITVIPSPQVIAAREEDRTVLVDMITGRYYAMNSTGGRIWFLLGEGADVRATAAQIAKEFEVAPEAAKNHVETFVQELASLGLVNASQPSQR